MKNYVMFFAMLFLFTTCKKEIKTSKKTTKYPVALTKVFDKHGKLSNWKNMQTLSFKKGDEKHLVDLQTRKTVVKTSKYSLGFDGENIWVSDTTVYKKDPKFYYNLYFYFYAMPFVLADEGIIYEKTNDLVYKGQKFPGIKISYQPKVGSSPEDNYFLYYHPKTFQMEWLGYTVTYFSKQTSKKVRLIRYNSWEKVGNLLLPKQITWYQKGKDGNPTEPAKPGVDFTFPLINKTKLKGSFFEKPISDK